MGSRLLRNLSKGKKELRERKHTKKHRPDTDTMISRSTLWTFRLMMSAFFLFAIALSAYAPNKAPKLPEGVRIVFVVVAFRFAV